MDFLKGNIPQEEIDEFLETETSRVQETEEKILSGKATAENQDQDIYKCVENVLDYFTRTDYSMIHNLEQGNISKEECIDILKKYIDSQIPGLEDAREKNAVLKAVENLLWAYDVITPLVDDPDISDIRCIGYNMVRYKKFGKRYTSPIKFGSPQLYEQFVRRIGTRNKTGLSDQNAIQTFTDNKSHPDFILRFNISTKYVNSGDFPIVQIRKIPKVKKDLNTLIKEGLVTAEQAAYLIQTVKNKGSILVCGKSGSGKTTLMNMLIDYVDDQVSIECIQESEELFSESHPELVCQHVVAIKGDGRFRYELKDLARSSLVADIDMFVIGEIKGDEARDLFTATNTGAFYMASIHAAKATEALTRVSDFIKYASDYSQEEILRMMSSNTKAVVFLKDYSVYEIVEVVGFDKNGVIYKTVFHK